MVHIYTFCDKTLVGRLENQSAKFLCENLYKLNFKIEESCIFSNKYDYASLNFKNKDIYFLLMQKTSNNLNSFLANLAGCEVSENKQLKQTVEEYYKQSNKPLDGDASLEWLIAKTAICITNPNGKTQGYLLKMGETEIFVLPNNYPQLKKIYNDCILDYLEKYHNINYKSETYKTFGLHELHIKAILNDYIKNKDGIVVTIFSKGLENDVVIKAKENNIKFEDYRREIFAKIEKYIYSVSSLSMQQKLEQELINQKINISFAGDNSLAKLLYPLSQDVYYNINQSQIFTNLKSISNFLNNNIEAVSPEVVYDIAVKLLEKTKCHLVLVTFCNISNNKQGETLIAIGNNSKIDIYKNVFSGTNDEIIDSATQTAKFYLLKRLSFNDIRTI